MLFIRCNCSNSFLYGSILATNHPRLIKACAALDHFMHNSETLIEAADEYVYEHGVILPPSSAMEIRLIAPVLVFNTALSHHLLASTMEADPEMRARLLERAKQLYKLALGERSVEYSTEFKFAIINNIAVVCKTTGQVEEANMYLTFLVSLRMHLSSAGERSTSPSVSGFWINIFGKGSMAPAA